MKAKIIGVKTTVIDGKTYPVFIYSNPTKPVMLTTKPLFKAKGKIA